MADDWRTVQVFLSEKGIHEVELNTAKSLRIRCNCASFKRFFPCVHAKYVKEQITKSPDGISYSVSIPDVLDDDESLYALDDPKLFREFILKYGKVLVID